MNSLAFDFAGTQLVAFGSGALFWPEHSLLCVSDLHLGKAERMSRRTGIPAPPYEIEDTLTRLQTDIDATRPATVMCLGDSFDDLIAAQALPESARLWIARMQAGRRWIWIEGNHDPGPLTISGEHLHALHIAPLTFRHIAVPEGKAEVSGHYHPKVYLPTRARRISRPAFVYDTARLILPAYGTYTGGLDSQAPVFADLLDHDARAILTGPRPISVPMPRKDASRSV